MLELPSPTAACTPLAKVPRSVIELLRAQNWAILWWRRSLVLLGCSDHHNDQGLQSDCRGRVLDWHWSDMFPHNLLRSDTEDVSGMSEGEKGRREN